MEDYGLDARHGLSFPLPVPLFPPLCRFLWWGGVKETREPHYDCKVPHSFEVDGGGSEGGDRERCTGGVGGAEIEMIHLSFIWPSVRLCFSFCLFALIFIF